MITEHLTTYSISLIIAGNGVDIHNKKIVISTISIVLLSEQYNARIYHYHGIKLNRCNAVQPLILYMIPPLRRRPPLLVEQSYTAKLTIQFLEYRYRKDAHSMLVPESQLMNTLTEDYS